MTDIVEWLRTAPSNEWCDGQLRKAADEIERLRAALEPFAKAANNFDDIKPGQDPAQWFIYSGRRYSSEVAGRGSISVVDLRRARAALAKATGGQHD